MDLQLRGSVESVLEKLDSLCKVVQREEREGEGSRWNGVGGSWELKVGKIL